MYSKRFTQITQWCANVLVRIDFNFHGPSIGKLHKMFIKTTIVYGTYRMKLKNLASEK